MKIYIQEGFPFDFSYAAYAGAQQAGDKIYYFDEIEQVPIGMDFNNNPFLVVTNIDDTLEYFQRSKRKLFPNLTIPTPLNIPDEIASFTKRTHEFKTLKQFSEEEVVPIFVKPVHKNVNFPSGVLRNKNSRKELYASLKYQGLPDFLPVMTSDFIEMESEYRCFVLRNELVGIQHYRSDFKIFPDIKTIEAAIAQYKSAPIAYTIDFAVTDKKETVLIECNDFWSVGSYGLPGDLYLKCLKARWLQIFTGFPTIKP